MSEGDGALADLLRRLEALDYDFVTVTPATHARIVARPDKKRARTLRDIFGWSLPFDRETLPADLFALLERAGAVERVEGGHRSRLRVSRVGAHLFLHSAYPTDGKDSVFLGPDTYRFVRFLAATLADWGPVSRLVDMGAGSGAGAICAAAMLPGARLTLVDSNPEALRLARINAEAAGVEVETIEGVSVDAAPGPFDLLIANPPYLMDEGSRAYRDGGGMNGAALALEWALAGARSGDVLLYTGAAIVDGEDALRAALEAAMPALGRFLLYEELDPDLFGEELGSPAYRGVERIAAIGAVITRTESNSAGADRSRPAAPDR
ncbi:MAG TPA: class I SAM-dependent methyltransferase [Allosphingosinicella sp.]|nr:class I SAM-dependent methyltransferase [Allosphingosinicella sp.]